MALLLTLRGTAFMYYGEEIGMRDISLSRKEILDPPGKRYWPIYKGRDGCRSPMQWDGSQYAGFSSAQPWLPVHPNHQHRNVAAQKADPGSIFNFTQAILAVRKKYPALQHGDFTVLNSSKGTLAFTRQTEEQMIFVGLNFKNTPEKVTLPDGPWQVLFSSADAVPNPPDDLLQHEVRILIQEA
jgi:alpha-glucosidase